MNIFERAKSRADAIAPPPADRPLVAAATAFGFGLLVTGVFVALQWCGLPFWMAWLGAALVYGVIAYGDCTLGWNHHTLEYRQALKDLKEEERGPLLH